MQRGPQDDALNDDELFCCTDYTNDCLVHFGEVGAILNRVMCRHDTGRDHQHLDDVIVDAQAGANMDHHASERDLVQIVVEDLSEWTAVVCPSCLLTINRINSLIPKVGEYAQEPDPAWQGLREGWIEVAHGDET